MARFSVLLPLLLTGMALGLPVLATVRAKSDRFPDYRPVPGWPKVPDGVKLGPVSAVATDASDRVYVAHRGKKPVVVFDAEGQFIRSWGDGEIDTAHGLRVDPRGNVWVTDMGGHRVLKFSPKGKLLLALGKRGTKGDGPDRFDRPTDVAVSRTGDFYVSDGYGNSRVLKFSGDGKLLKQWGKKGTPFTVVLPLISHLVWPAAPSPRPQVSGPWKGVGCHL